MIPSGDGLRGLSLTLLVTCVLLLAVPASKAQDDKGKQWHTMHEGAECLFVM